MKKQKVTTKTTRNYAQKNSAHKSNKRRNSVENLGRKFGIARSTVYEYLKRRIIPGVKVGNRWVIPDDVEDRIKALAYENWPPPREKLQR